MASPPSLSIVSELNGTGEASRFLAKYGVEDVARFSMAFMGCDFGELRSDVRRLLAELANADEVPPGSRVARPSRRTDRFEASDFSEASVFPEAGGAAGRPNSQADLTEADVEFQEQKVRGAELQSGMPRLVDPAYTSRYSGQHITERSG